MKIKITTIGFSDAIHSLDIEEARKAYYLFLNPNERGIFNSGLALRGQDIRQIDPDYHGTMGWNETHELDDDDWNEIRGKNVDRKLREAMFQSKKIAELPNVIKDRLLELPFSEVIKLLPEKPEQKQINEAVKQLSDKMKV